MKYRGIFEYEYPTEHKPPVSIDVRLHGDCVKGKIVEWEYKPQEQEPILDKIRAEIENDWQLKKYPSSPFSCGLRRAIEIIDKVQGIK